jgi:hypothetical protein
MEHFYLLLSLTLPVFLGTVCIKLFMYSKPVGYRAINFGAGSLAGLLAITLLMRLIDFLGLAISFRNVGIAAAVIISAALLILFYRNKSNVTLARSGALQTELLPWQKWLFVLLLVLIIIRLLTLGLEVVWRPLYPWDATMHWATKARVWFDASSIVPFVDKALWLELGGEGVFTDHHPDYPITTPLLQVWINSAIGRWDDSLMNLPWIFCLAALLLLFYGQGLAAGVDRITAITFTYMLCSMPLVNTHVALAGYADLILGICYVAAIMSFYNWSRTRDNWQALLAFFFAAFCPLIKNEGTFWALTFIPGLMVVLFSQRAIYFLAGCFIVALTTLIFVPKDLVIAGQSLDGLDLYFRSGALGAIINTFFIYGSWNLFFYLMAAIVPLGFVITGGLKSPYLGVMIVLASALGLFLVLFTFTVYATGAIDVTGASRIGLQLVPGLMFLTMLIFSDLSARTNSITSRQYVGC